MTHIRKHPMDKFVHSLLYASRWILAPIYFGLIGALVTILIKFYTQLFHLLAVSTTADETSMVLNVLGLVDITLVGGLILMVMLSGYENFISNKTQSRDSKIGWLGKLNANSLKMKVAASIVAISSIHLLQIFMTAPDKINNKAFIYIALHLTFVVSACLMGLLNSKTGTKNS
jgi:uncharacterized protein (TIGR00645 family)